MEQQAKIVSDGTAAGTRLYDAEGNDITKGMRIKSITWTVDTADGPTGMATATIVVRVPKVEVTGQMELAERA